MTNKKLTLTKECIKCGILKSLVHYPKAKSMKHGYRNECKDCKLAYDRTIRGMAGLLIRSQRQRNTVIYSKTELEQWLTSQVNFKSLYGAWTKSGYKKELKPSVDRIDDYGVYEFSNIQLMTWKENNRKGKDSRRLGYNNKVNKAVQVFRDNILIDTLHSTMEVERKYGVANTNVSSIARGVGKAKTAKGLTFSYIDKTAEEID